MSRSPPHPPPPLTSHSIHYPESEFEHSHSRSPSIATLTLSPIPASRSLPPSPPFAASSAHFAGPPTPFVSLSSIPPEPSDALPASIAPLAASIDAEELTRQSLGASSRTSSPRLPHSSLDTNHMHSPAAAAAGLGLGAGVGVGRGGGMGVGGGGGSGYYEEAGPLSIAAGGNGLSSASGAVIDPAVASIIDTTRTLAAQHQLPFSMSQSPASSPTAASSSTASDTSSSHTSQQSSHDQVAVVYSAGLLQLSQRLKEIHHPLSARVMLAVGAAGGQMKAADYPASLATCQRALSTLESWPSLSGLPVKESMLRLFKQLKQSFTSSDALQARLLYVEFFLTLSALLAVEHREWSLALQHSAQKGLKGQAAEAVRSMTKIVKLLFTAGLSKPPSAYRRKGPNGAGGGRGDRGEDGRRERRGEGGDDARGEEKPVDMREREVQQAVRMLAWRRPTDTGSSSSESDADGEEKRLNVDDFDLLCVTVGVQSDLSDSERQQNTLHPPHDIAARVQQLPYHPASALNLAMQQLIRPNQSKSTQSSSSLSSSLASLSLHSPSIRIPAAIPSAAQRAHSSSRATTPLSTQRQLKFHAASASVSSPVAASSSLVGSTAGAGLERGLSSSEVVAGGVGGGVVGVSPHVQPLLHLIKANKRDEVFRLLHSMSDGDEKNDQDE